MKHAHRRSYDFKNPEKYRLFLKKQFTTLKPHFYSVAYYRRVETTDGPMYAVKIVPEGIENPELEPIAEVWINGEFVYLWNDHCWAIATNDKNRPICEYSNGAYSLDPYEFSGVDGPPLPCHKVMLIYRIGTDPVD